MKRKTIYIILAILSILSIIIISSPIFIESYIGMKFDCMNFEDLPSSVLIYGMFLVPNEGENLTEDNIKINPNLNEKETIKTTIHENIHKNQYEHGRLYECGEVLGNTGVFLNELEANFLEEVKYLCGWDN